MPIKSAHELVAATQHAVNGEVTSKKLMNTNQVTAICLFGVILTLDLAKGLNDITP